jgi:hypothetical protein
MLGPVALAASADMHLIELPGLSLKGDSGGALQR